MQQINLQFEIPPNDFSSEIKRNSRKLKIEEDGDFASGKIKPKIRLKGYWLERAGFKPGNHVSVNLIMEGVIELRSRSSESAV